MTRNQASQSNVAKPSSYWGSISTLREYSAGTDEVDAVVDFLDLQQANLTAVYAVKFGDYFATHFLFEVASLERFQAIKRACEDGGDLKHVDPWFLAHENGDLNGYSFSGESLYQFDLFGVDRQGLVAEIERRVKRHKGVILSVSARAYPAPGDGLPRLFALQMKFSLREEGYQLLLEDIQGLSAREAWHFSLVPLSPSESRSTAEDS